MANFRPISRFPASAFDISVIAPERELYADMSKRLIALVPPELFESIDYLGQYTGPPIPEGHKSTTFRVKLNSHERTLSSAAVRGVHHAVMNGLRSFGYRFQTAEKQTGISLEMYRGADPEREYFHQRTKLRNHSLD